MSDREESDTATLLATATCEDCGVVACLSAPEVPARLQDTVDGFRSTFRACPSCGSLALDFDQEVEP